MTETETKSLARTGLERIGAQFASVHAKARDGAREIWTAMEKGIEAAKISAPPAGTCGEIDLRLLPRFISFKAALLREKLTLQMALTGILIIFTAHFAVSRLEITRLHEALRQKEYILAPGVVDLTPASPQTVPDSYVRNAVVDFLSQLGNVNSTNIDEQYGALEAFMSPALRVRFDAEGAEWKAHVKADGLTEAMTILNDRIETSESGRYHVFAEVRTDSYIKSEYIGARDEVVEMELQLVPPRDGKRWFLEITGLSRMSASAHKSRQSLSGGSK